MTAPTYQQVAPRLYALSDGDDTRPAGYWAGYYTSAGALFGTTADVQQVWDDVGGVYLFLGTTPADLPAFVAGLQILLRQLSPSGKLRMLWIADPAAGPWTDWQTCGLEAVAAGPSTPPLSWLVARQATVALGTYSILIQGGTSLTLSNSDTGGYGMQIAAGGFTFFAPGCGYPAQSDCMLPFAGPQAGAFISRVLLDNSQGDDMANLGVMLRYAAPDDTSAVGETKSLSLPILTSLGAADMGASFLYDPLNPLLPDRSNISIYEPSANVALASAFTTTRGYPMTLSATNGGGALTTGRFAFCKTPVFATQEADEVYYDYHLAPDGAFAIQVVPPAASTPTTTETDHFMMGVSGIEYADLPASGNALLFFRAGQSAYLAPDSSDTPSPLSSFGTTAYATVLPPSAGSVGLTYYAQPLQAPLFRSVGDLGPGFLDFHAMPSGQLPGYTATSAGPTAAAPNVMPIAAYKWLDVANIEWARQLEAAVFAPMRRIAVGLTASGGTAGRSVTADRGSTPVIPADANPNLAVTPQGLIAKLTADLASWAGITLAHMPDSIHQEIELTAVGQTMQTALQSNQLFFVVSNVNEFMRQSSVRYQLTQLDTELLAARGVPAAVIAGLVAAYGPLPTAAYDNESAFLQSYPQDPPSLQYQPDVLAVTGLLEADIEGWTFQLSPRAWRSGADDPTLMLFKFCDRPLTELVAEGGCWGWQQAAWDHNDSILTTQTVLQEIIAAAREAAEDVSRADDPLTLFYRQVAANRLWNGVLFFNAPVDFTQMPAALQFLAGGIDVRRFFAHHLGFSLTGFIPTADGMQLQQTAAFGAINYQDAQDLVADSSIAFGFKTMQLQVRFANARVVDFAAQVELMVNELFSASLAKSDAARGNNLIMNGAYQRSGTLPAYSFALSGQNLFTCQYSILTSVEMLAVELVTGNGAATPLVQLKFVLAGNLRYGQGPDFDLFSYGADIAQDAIQSDGFLRMTGLVITMQFNRADPTRQTFTVNEGATGFDLANSQPRAGSLVNNFPLVINRLIACPAPADATQAATGQSPEDLGFTSIAAPLEQTPLQPPWYGLVFSLDLGTFGALAGSLGLTVSVLAAWSRGRTADEAPIYLGLALPNIPAIGGSIPLQGVLKLGFRSFEFSTYTTDENTLGYMLTLRRFSLSALCWSFPPGNTDIHIFGAPGQPTSCVGWYAAYDDGKGNERANVPNAGSKLTSLPAAPRGAAETAAARRLRSGRRTPLVES